MPVSALWAQCFQLLDGNGAFSNNPYFVSCTPGNYTIFIQPNQDIGPYIINWGDGSPNATGANLLAGTNISHTYTATTDTFNIVVTDQGTGCVVNGVAVLERNPLASIQLPAGDDNFGCTPVTFRFINSSTQTSETTTFVWDFGDGSPVETYDYTNAGDTIFHTFLPGIGVQSCNLEVTLTATNYCGSSTASFFPLRVWDLDEAQVDASATLLCYPDTIVQYTNNTIRNCFPEGNQSQRYERWNFGDYWGLGYDSIIDWRPWNPPIINPPPIGYPGVGTYTVQLIDSSYCGLDSTTLSITITNPPTAVLTSDKDTICEGEVVRFFNNSVGGANQFSWNFDQGSGWQNLSGNNKNRTYTNSGDYTIRLAVAVAGAQGCADTSSVDLYVNPSPNTDFSFDVNNQCDSMRVNFTDLSTGNIVSWNWDFDNGNTFVGQNPPSQLFPNPGTYTIKLVTTNNRGCPDSTTKQVRVREVPQAGFRANNICLNTTASFIDTSSASIDAITDYKWYFGDGDSSTARNPNHLYTAFGTYTVTQIVSNGFCSDTSSITVDVENNPTAAFTVDNEDGCSRLTVNFTNQSSANAMQFEWDFGDGSPSVQARDTFHTYTNNTTSDTSFVVRMIAQTLFGCADTVYDTIQVFPVPIPAFNSDAVLDCGPQTVNFTNKTQGDSLDFFWTFGDGSPVVNDTNPTHVFQNQTLFISNYNVSLIVVSNNGCRDTTTQQITVYPEPRFSFAAVPDSGCSPLRVQFPSVVGAVDYQWDFGDGNIASGPTPSHTFINNTTNDLNYTIRLIARNSFGCADTSFGNVLVYPNPTSAFTLDTNVGCQPLPIQITNNSTGASTFAWTFGDGTTSDTADASFVKTFTNGSNVAVFNTIQLITSTTDGCRDTLSRQVEVHPFISVDFTSDTVGCHPYPVQFSNQSVGAASYNWTFGDGNVSAATNPQNIYQNTTTANQTFVSQLIGTSTEGCSDTARQNILVYPKPTAAFVLDTNKGCQPLDISVDNNSVIADSLIWTFGDGSTSNTAANQFSKTYTNTTQSASFNTFQLIVLTNNGCRDTLSEVVEVHPFISVDFTSDTVGCHPYPVQFSNQSVGATSYNWAFGDGNTSAATNPQNIYQNTTTANQTFVSQLIGTSTEGCSDTARQNILVYPKPTAAFVLDTNKGCQPLDISVDNNSVIADSLIWTFGDGSNSNTAANQFSKTYTNTTQSASFNILQLIVLTNNGCRDTLSEVVEVHPFISVDFTSDTVGCHPYPVQFNNQSVGAASYNWAFGDGNTSAATNPQNIYQNTTTANQTFVSRLIGTSTEGCTDTARQNILVYPKPTAAFVLDTNKGCQPLDISVDNNSVIADSLIWTFGDGSNSNTAANQFSKVYTNTSQSSLFHTFQLIVLTNNGCRDTLSEVVEVHPFIQAAFSSDTVGCSPFRIPFTNQSVGASNYAWDFDDGGTSPAPNPRHTFVNTGTNNQTFAVNLIATSPQSCSDTVTKNILIYPKPTAIFSVDDSAGCHPLPVSFTNQSTLRDSCVWTYGDGNGRNDCSPNFTHTYNNSTSFFPVDYPAQLIIITDNGCRDTARKNIRVNPQIIAAFDSDTAGCHPFPVRFNDQSTGAAFYEWRFGDGGASPQQNPQHFFLSNVLRDTIFTTQLKVRSNFGCVDSISQDITVYPKPIADYSIDENDGCHPLPVSFLSNSSLADSCVWKFGDGVDLIDCGPSVNHTYNNTLSLVPINYTSRLEVYTNRGCADTLSRSIQVRPQVTADFDVDTIGCSPLDLTYRSQSFGAVSFQWDFGNGRIAMGQIVTNQYTNTGSVDSIYTTQLIAQSLYQCNDTLTKDILVRPTPIPDFTPSPTFQVYPNATVSVTNETNPGNWSYRWDFKDSATSILEDPAPHTYSTWGQYLIKLVAYTPFCADSIEKLVEIDVPVPVADFSDSAAGCEPLKVQFTNESLYGNRFEWDFGDGGTSTAENPTYTYLNEGDYTVTLKVLGFAPNKEDTEIKANYIQVFNRPRAQFFANKRTVYIPNDPLVLSNTSVDADEYEWNFGDGNTSNEESPVYYFQEEGFFDIYLVASTSLGCRDTFYMPTQIEAKLEGNLEVPNAFTPNPNGSNGGTVNPFASGANLNDVFYAKIQGAVKYELNIFNKWGELLFVSKDIGIGWDGYYKDELCQQDVYVWKVTAEFADGTSIVKVGDLMLLR